MKRLVLTTALTLAIAAPAFASDQLARSVGVEPGVYSTAQLIQLKDAIENDDHHRANAIRNSASGSVSFSSKGATSGSAQLAASLGVDASDYSTAELIQLRDATEDADAYRVAAIKRNAGTDFSVSTKSAVSGGKAQLAASLGVNPAEYSTAELVRLKNMQENDRSE